MEHYYNTCLEDFPHHKFITETFPECQSSPRLLHKGDVPIFIVDAQFPPDKPNSFIPRSRRNSHRLSISKLEPISEDPRE
ncbi:hypothetical protein K7432_010453 [Basidiobolus ranarum]|uniref:Uncharacterized protein n=1 Tax=Basidiobolus ranarum TaxID=34480 RepID=A0ABR2VVM1_9FUNG